MSKEFDIIKDKEDVCQTCTYRDSCKLLKYLNNMARFNKVDSFDNRFSCSFFEKQPISLKRGY